MIRRRTDPTGWRCEVLVTDDLTITLHMSQTLYDSLTEAHYLQGCGFFNHYSHGLTPEVILSDPRFRPAPPQAHGPAEEGGVPSVSAYRCTECDHLTTEPGGSIYECGACDHSFTREDSADGDSNRCPRCGLFSSLLDDESCPECGSQVEETPAFQCRHCEEIYLTKAEALACCPPPEEGETTS